MQPIINELPKMRDQVEKYHDAFTTWDISEDFASLPAVTDGVPGNNPMLHTDDPLNDNNITALDKWFHTQFPDDAKTLEESIDMLKQLKLMMNQLEAFVVDDMDKYENPYLEAVEIKDGEELPSSGTAADAEALFNNEKADAGDEHALEQRLDNTADSADTLFADLDFEKLIEEGRDNLYATQYIMGMFSYETSALEGLYVMQGGGKDETDIYKMSDGNKISPGNADTYYNDLLDNPPSTKEGEWWNMKKTFTDNKTLTNKMLDMEHCISYGNEVEYILYGDSNEKNGLKIDTTMAFTRFALNMAPVLSVYWKDTMVIRVANAISGVTQGIVLAPLVKLVICLGVCAAESAVDMNYLKAGLPVAFVKTDARNQLFIELTIDEKTFEDAVKSGSLDYAKNSMKVGERSITSSSFPFSYSDYLSMYLYIALCANEDDIYKRTADVIQRNMETNYPELAGFRMSKAQTYFQLHADIRVKPLMMKLPYAQMSGIEVLDTATWNTFEIEPMTRGY